jgi:hypothetical protein
MATIIISLMFCLSLFLSSIPAYAAVFNVSSGDVTGLIAAITAANANGEENTINLTPGTYTLTAIDNGTFLNGSSNGLPVITSAMTVAGAERATTIIERDANAPFFRILRVSAAGILTLQRLTLRGGEIGGSGGGISNTGTLTLIDCAVTGNRSGSSGGGGILNRGTLTLIDSTLIRNVAMAGGGIENDGAATISRTTFEGNGGNVPGGGGLHNVVGARVTITDFTFVHNHADLAGGVFNARGTVTITNTTFAQNSALSGGGGLVNSGLGKLQNTAFAENTVGIIGGPSEVTVPGDSLQVSGGNH